MAQERLQKILAQAGIASRRKAEELIADGEITINGKVAKLGDKAELGKDAIKVRGKLLLKTESPVYLAFHKPKGVISAMTDPEGRETVASFLKKIQSRVFPVGQMDFNTEGLLLLTNDGNLAKELQEREDIPRVYEVKVKGAPDSEMLKRVGRGMRTGNKYLKPHSVFLAEKLTSKSKVEVVLMTPGNPDVKSLFETRGFLVERIIRTSIGHLTLKGLKPGHYKILKKSQVDALLEQPELGLKQVVQEQEKKAANLSNDPIKIRPVTPGARSKPRRSERRPGKRKSAP